MFFKKKSKDVEIPEFDVKELVKSSGLKHIAFIMDGNGRWAKRRALPREAGHKVGANVFKDIVRYCINIGIDTITVYAFSTENWSRPRNEINELMKLLRDFLKEAEDKDDENKTKYIFLGDKNALDEKLAEQCRELESMTASHKNTLNIAFNYGGRAEIVHAVNEALKAGKSEITEQDIEQNLYTSSSPEPDLIIRTAGELRLSNFLMWQSAYSELYFTDVLWPDMTRKDVDMAIYEFSKRKRNFGGVKNA